MHFVCCTAAAITQCGCFVTDKDFDDELGKILELEMEIRLGM